MNKWPLLENGELWELPTVTAKALRRRLKVGVYIAPLLAHATHGAARTADARPEGFYPLKSAPRNRPLEIGVAGAQRPA